jgi:hypothetical protein
MNGKYNIAAGFLSMGLFMLYGFLLIWLHDFASGKPAFERIHMGGKHFEVRLAHVHGNLFAFLNIVIGYLLLHFKERLKHVKPISILAITGLIMPLGILTEVYFGLPPFLVLIGAVSITIAVIWLGIAFLSLDPSKQ